MISVLKTVLYRLSGGIPPVNPPVGDSITHTILEFCREARSVREIADMLGYKDKKTVRKYLDPLLADGSIVRTIPDKPNSRNQKYITVSGQ